MYHKFAISFKLSDTALWVLYIISHKNETVNLKCKIASAEGGFI